MLTILQGDALVKLTNLSNCSADCCVTSPPYWGLRDYGVFGQIGLEKTPEQYVFNLVRVFREVRRVLKRDGTLWLNLGDSYARQAGDDSTKEVDSGMKTGRTGKSSSLFKKGSNTPPPGLKPKDLIGIPWRVAFALQSEGWYLRSDIIWHKPNPMPESVTDRPIKSHEYVFLLSTSERYYFNMETVSKNNRGTVWTIPTQPYHNSHFATFPEDLIKPCILATCPIGGTVLDPFAGSGTTGQVAIELGRKAVLIELNPKYVELIERRTHVTFGFRF